MPQSTNRRAPQDVARSRALHASARRVLPGGTSRTVHQTQPHPIYAREGRKTVVIDVDGNSYLDFYNNATALIHGHAHPETVAAIESQARRGTAFSLPVEGQIALAEILSDRIASVEQVRFVNSGSEAVMLAVQAARAITGRSGIVKFEGCYHGSAEAVEVSLEPDPATWGDAHAPASVAYTAATPPGLLDSVLVAPFNDVAAAEAVLRAHADEVAAVVLDVLPMRIGFTAATGEWLSAIRRISRELGVLLIADEVISFRLALGGAQAVYAFDADLTALGKVVGGGLPVGAIAGPSSIMRAFDGSAGRALVPNAGTFNANPLTLAAGIATLEALTPDALDHVNELGDELRGSLDDAIERLGIPAHTTGIGSLFGLHMTDRRFTDYRGYWHACVADQAARRRQIALYDGLRERGILFSNGGVGALSTAMSTADIDAFVTAFIDETAVMEADGLWSEVPAAT